MKMTMLCKPVMRVAFLAVCATALCTLPIMAQDNSAPPAGPAGPPMGGRGGRGGMEEHQLAMLTKKLALTPDQVTQVKAIDDDTMKQATAVHNDATLAPADKRAKMMDLHKAAQDKIRGLLTDDQKTKYDALQAEMKERWQNRQGGAGAPPPQPPPQ